jgi:hypothetical protein
VPKSISVKAETPHYSATMVSLSIDDTIVGRGLTAAQVHLLIGEILERVVLPHHEKPNFQGVPDEATSEIKIGTA